MLTQKTKENIKLSIRDDLKGWAWARGTFYQDSPSSGFLNIVETFLFIQRTKTPKGKN